MIETNLRVSEVYESQSGADRSRPFHFTAFTGGMSYRRRYGSLDEANIARGQVVAGEKHPDPLIDP